MTRTNRALGPWLLLVACSCAHLPEAAADSAAATRQEPAAAAPPIRPQDRNPQSPWYRAADRGRWYFDFIAGAEYEADYPGSDDNELELDPNIRVMFKDPWSNRHLLSIGEWRSTFDLTDDLAFSVNVEYEQGRDADDNPALRGLDEIEDTVELAPSLHYRIGDFSFAAVAQPDLLNRGKGFVWFVGAGYDKLLFDDRLRLATSLDLSGADSTHMRTEFGITGAEAGRTGNRAYRPDAALKSLSWATTAEYFFTDRWSLFAGSEVEHYLKEAADSPLIADQGSDWNVGFGLGMRYSF
ncbi:MAG: MipA/OmpV family protein [Planctomycetota bacterium]